MGARAMQSQGLQTIQDGLKGLVPNIFPDIFPGMFEENVGSTDPAVLTASKGTYTYQDVQAATFLQGTTDKNEVDINDIKQQGDLGDCYFMAAMGAIARIKPDWIKGLIKENRDPNDKTKILSYDVTFYDWGNDPITETITPKFAKDKSGLIYAYARAGDTEYTTGEEEIWPVIMEKAYAQWYGGYEEIHSGPCSRALRQLTGIDADYHEREFNVNYLFPYLSSYESIYSWLSRMFVAFVANKAVCISTKEKFNDTGADVKDKSGNVKIVVNHAYVLTKVNFNGQNTTIELYNPWGYDHPMLTLDMFEKCVAGYSCLDESMK